MAYRNRTIPDSDRGVRRFVYNFSRRVQADPAKYGFDAGDAAILVVNADEFIAKSFIASRPDSRTPAAIKEKNDVRKEVLEIFREYVARVRVNSAVTNGAKVGLGIALDKAHRKSPVPPPDSPPALRIRLGANFIHELSYADTDAMTRRGKPRGASHLVVLCAVGEKATADWNEARYVGAYTKYPIRIEHPPEHRGLIATYFAAWLMRSGKQSNWGIPVSMPIINAGGPAAQPTLRRHVQSQLSPERRAA